MISFTTFIIGVSLSAAVGWALVRVCEGHTPLLHPVERVLYAVLIGPLAAMEICFLLAWINALHFTLIGFLTVHAVLLIGLGYVLYKKKMLDIRAGSAMPESGWPEHTLMRYGLYALLAWTAARFLFGAFNLTQLPTYWDDSIDNWNMRGKAFYVEKDIILEIPNSNGTLTDKKAESSYPAAVPLFKTWLATLRGKWSEGLVNGIHAVWYVTLTGIMFFVLRRRLSPAWSVMGTYLLASQPLVLIQGVNPYADVLVAGCMIATVGAILNANDDHAHRKRWLLLAALTLGAMTFTKNEVLPLHLPSLALAIAFVGKKSGTKTAMMSACIVLTFLLPWLVFKWSNGLTFGNAKAVSGLTIGWHPEALAAVWNMLMKEANFLLIPLMLTTALMFGNNALTRDIRIVLSILMFVLGMQLCIYAFTPLATEAVRQTGLGRGLLQLMPLAVLSIVLISARMLRRG